MNMLGFLRMFKRKVNMPDMPSQQVDAMNSLMKPVIIMMIRQSQ